VAHGVMQGWLYMCALLRSHTHTHSLCTGVHCVGGRALQRDGSQHDTILLSQPFRASGYVCDLQLSILQVDACLLQGLSGRAEGGAPM
jgi:hypothetical protein